MLLQTVNPEAAAAIDGDFPKVAVGFPVKFISREGARRAGRSEFFASVMKQNADGSVDLLVMMEPEDFVEERHVNRKSEHQIYHVWEPVVPSMDDMQKLVDHVMKMVFGPFESPPMSMMEFLQQIDERVTALEKAKK